MHRHMIAKGALVSVLLVSWGIVFAQETAVEGEIKVEASVATPMSPISDGQKRPLLQPGMDTRIQSAQPGIKQPIPTRGQVERAGIKEIQSVRQGTQEQVKAIRQDGLQEIKDTRADARMEMNAEIKDRNADVRMIMTSSSSMPEKRGLVGERMDTSREAIEAKREAMLIEVKQSREAFQKDIALVRASSTKAIAAKKTELQNKLKIVKDEKKKAAVLKVGTSLQTVNDNLVKAMSSMITRQEEVAARMTTAIDEIATAGVDTMAARTLLSDALTAIENAKAKVTAQSGKIYSVDVTSEATLKEDASKARETLKTDVEAVRTAIEASRDALRAVAESIKELRLQVEANTEVQTGASL